VPPFRSAAAKPPLSKRRWSAALRYAVVIIAIAVVFALHHHRPLPRPNPSLPGKRRPTSCCTPGSELLSTAARADHGPLLGAEIKKTQLALLIRIRNVLTRSRWRSWRRSYESFAVYRVPASALAGLQQLAKSAGAQVDVEDWDKVLLRRATIDTHAATNRLANDDAPRLFVVQFSAPMTAEDDDLLRTHGVQHLAYVPENAVLVLGRGTAVAQLASAPQVQWVSVYDQSLKPLVPTPPLNNPVYVVQFANTPDTVAHINDFISRQAVLQVVAHAPYTNVKLALDAESLAALVDDPVVVAIELAGTAMLSGEREAASVTTIGATSTVYQNPVCVTQTCPPNPLQWQPFRPVGNGSYRSWLPSTVLSNAATYRIAIADSGIDNGTCGPHHPDLLNDMWVNDYINGADCAGDPVGHGTMVAGIAVGTPASGPTDAAGSNGTFNYGMGVASGAKIYDQRVWYNGLANTYGGIYTWANDAYNNGCVIQTQSFNFYAPPPATPVDGDYDANAQAWDAAVRDTYAGDSIDTPMPIVVSAGNICGGTADDRVGDCTSKVLSPSTAKNVISAGASESYRPGYSTCQSTQLHRQAGDFLANSFGNVAYVSRRGTDDGRIKPDILAPATMVGSTASQWSLNPNVHPGAFCRSDANQPTLYNIDTGTSFAAPQIAAAGLLLDAKYTTTFSPAMLKAALVGTAKSLMGNTDDYTGAPVAARPNTAQGFGRLFLADVLQGTQSYRFMDENSFTPFTAAGQSRGGSFTVADTSKPVVLVVAWTDEPGGINVSKELVRDLDFTASVGCPVYYGNVISSTTEYSVAFACGDVAVHDRANNVEMIVIPPGAGTSISWSVVVANWGSGTHNQKFALFGANVL
jgi:hypothetical protein